MQTIVVIEDDALSLNLMLTALRQAGFEAIGATSGTEGVALAQSRQPDLIISDIRMEEGDGYDALAEIRKDPALSATPFILMTGQASNESMRQGMELGADDYLAKPFRIDQLIAAVKARLRKLETSQAIFKEKLESLRTAISLAVPQEIRAPLSVVMGCAQALRTHAEHLRPKDIMEMANAIEGAGDRMQHLFENFLTYSYLEVASDDPAIRKELRSTLTPGAKRLIRNQARQRALLDQRVEDLVFDLEDGIVRIKDEHLLKIVAELVDNALKFSAPSTSIELSSTMRDGMYMLMVCDHGSGMTSQQIEEIDAFIQFERTDREQQGMGLGLSIVSRFIELYGGALAFESTPESGTRAIIKLPACRYEVFGTTSNGVAPFPHKA